MQLKNYNSKRKKAHRKAHVSHDISSRVLMMITHLISVEIGVVLESIFSAFYRHCKGIFLGPVS